MEKQKCPEIRFNNFDKEWNDKDFKSIFNYTRPDKYIVKSSEYMDSKKTPVLTANKGFILGYTSETETFDQACIIFDDFTLDSKYVDFPFMVKSSALKILTIQNDEVDDLYFCHNLLKQAKIEVMGHARHYIGVVQPTKVKTALIEEQQEISNFFQNLDQSITLHEKKLAQTQKFKKAMLEKMFPKQGSKRPEIRLNGFSGDWIETTLGNLGSIRRGASPRPIEDEKWFDKTSRVGWLRISDVSEQNGRIYNIDQKLSLAGQQKTLVLDKPHLILSIAATVGKPVINYVPTGIHDGFIVFLDLNADLEFMFQWLEKFRSVWFKLGQSGSQLNLNSELVKSQRLYLPLSKDEQIAIGQFFKKIDETCLLLKQELHTLNKLKQALLEKMFV